MYDGEWTLGSLLAARAEQEPDREIVRFEETAVTFGELDETASRVANALGALGLQQGDRAAIMLGNRAEYLGLWFGMARAGIVEVPLNTGVRGDMLVHMLNTTGCRLLVIDAQWLERIERIAPSSQTLERSWSSGTELWPGSSACRSQPSSTSPLHPPSVSRRTTLR